MLLTKKDVFFDDKINTATYYFDKILLSIIFFIGLLSDLQKLKSPIIRLFLQFFIVFIILIFNKNYILQTRLSYLDYKKNAKIIDYLDKEIQSLDDLIALNSNLETNKMSHNN